MTKINLYEMEIEGLTAEGWNLLVEQENAYGEPNEELVCYTCCICGAPITAAQGDDNGGLCDNC